MWLFANNITAVFWFAVLPAFLSMGFMIFRVRDPDRQPGLRHVQSPLSRAELQRLGSAYWAVNGVAVVFTLARFSEAFLLLKAQSVGLPVMLVPAVLVVMNLMYAFAAYPAGVLSDASSRRRVLSVGLALLVVADLVLAFSSEVTGVMIGVGLWGLHMGFTQGLLTALVADVAPAELRGTAFGMFNLLIGLALLAASTIAGALWDWVGPQATFLSGAAFTSVSLIGFLLLVRRATMHAEQTAA
jgi:MFS family permease